MSAVIRVRVASSVSNIGGSEETINSCTSGSSDGGWESHGSGSSGSEGDRTQRSSGTEESLELSSSGEDFCREDDEGEVSEGERERNVDEGNRGVASAILPELGLTNRHAKVVRRRENNLRATAIVDETFQSEISAAGGHREVDASGQLKSEEGIEVSMQTTREAIGSRNEDENNNQDSRGFFSARETLLGAAEIPGGMIARLCESVSDTSRVNFLMSVVEAYVQSLHIVQLAGEETRAQLVRENEQFRKEIAEVKTALEQERKAVQEREERVAALEREVDVSRDLGSWQVSLCEFESRLLAREQEIDRTARERLRQCLEHIATRENQAWEAISQSSTRTSSQ